MTAHDPVPPVPLAAQAWEAWLRGDAARAQALAHAASAAVNLQLRRQRQQIQIVQLAIDCDWDRATGLAAEHLAEFPRDQLIRRLLASLSSR